MAIDLTTQELSEATSFSLISGNRSDESESGKLYTLNFSDEPHYDIRCVIEGLGSAVRDFLMTVISVNASDDFTVEIEGNTYTGELTADPSWRKSGGLSTLTFGIRATQD